MKKEKVNKNQQMESSQEELVNQSQDLEQVMKINKSTLKDLIAPSGIDASHFDYLEIFSKIVICEKTAYSSAKICHGMWVTGSAVDAGASWMLWPSTAQ